MQVQGIKNFRKILYFAFCAFNVINSFKYKTMINDLCDSHSQTDIFSENKCKNSFNR